MGISTRNLIVDRFKGPFIYGPNLDFDGNFEKFYGKDKTITKIINLFRVVEGTWMDDKDFGLSLHLFIAEGLTDTNIRAMEGYIKFKMGVYIPEVTILESELIGLRKTKTVQINMKIYDSSTRTEQDITLSHTGRRIQSFSVL